MSDSFDKFLGKLQKVAAEIAESKPKLHFFGLVHWPEAPPDRWDLVLSSDQLKPWTFDTIKYVVERLKMRLTAGEMIRIAGVVALPRNDTLIAELLGNGEVPSRRVRTHNPADSSGEAEIIWSMDQVPRHLKV